MHQISLGCIEKLVECMEGIDIEEMDCDTCFKMQEILREEIGVSGMYVVLCMILCVDFYVFF